MATAATPGLDSVELFYSYAHTDELLCQQLQKHLTALKRSGLIRDWYDRKIDPGAEWNEQIQSALERADLILLLISSDFIASQYIFERELPFALTRHTLGRATVIPILLRPVEWHDMPFAKLQMLPSKAIPITKWADQDEAFTDVAARIREVLYNKRLAAVSMPLTEPETSHTTVLERTLDAAVARELIVEEPTDVVMMIRRPKAKGLKNILRLDRSYSATSDDVQSSTLSIEFPVPSGSNTSNATVEVILEAPTFDPPVQQRSLIVPAEGDTGVFVFLVTPKRSRAVRINVRLLQNGAEIGSRMLRADVVPAAWASTSVEYGVESIELHNEPRVGDFTRLLPREMPKGAPAPIFIPRDMPRPKGGGSRGGTWVKVAGVAAMAVLVVTTTVTFIKSPVNGPSVPSESKDDVRKTPSLPSKPQPPPIVLRPTPVVRPPVPVPVKPDSSSAELESARQRLTRLRVRVVALKGSLADLRRKSVGSGTPLRSDLTLAETNLDRSLEEAELAIQAGNAQIAQEKMRAAEEQAKKVSNTVAGR